MDKNFWKDKNVLITGFEGFVGSNLTKQLIPYAGKIAGLDIRTKRKETILTASSYKKIVAIKGSVCNYRLLEGILKRYQIDIVFHLAAEAIVGSCQKKPLRAFSSNIRGTWNVLEAARNFGKIKAVVVASSDKAYGSHSKLPYTEDAFLAGVNPYDVSKSCADLIANSYFHTYGLPVTVTRCGNIYGPGDFNMSRIIPDAISCAIKDRQLLIRSDGTFTRDYIHVNDVVSGYITLAEKMQKDNLCGEAFNLSNEKPVSVLELAKTAFALERKKPNYKILNRAKYEIKHQYLSARKARRLLGWKPGYTLKEGLKDTIEWYRLRTLDAGKILKAYKYSGLSIPIEDGIRLRVPQFWVKEINLLKNWRNKNCNVYPTQFKATTKSTRNWLKNQVFNNKDRILFMIDAGKGGIIGHLGLSNLDFSKKTCEIDNVVRGVHAKFPGIMARSMEAILDFAFHALKMNRVVLRVFSDNARAIRFYRRCGFRYKKNIPLLRQESKGMVKFIEAKGSAKKSAHRFFSLMEIAKDGKDR